MKCIKILFLFSSLVYCTVLSSQVSRSEKVSIRLNKAPEKVESPVKPEPVVSGPPEIRLISPVINDNRCSTSKPELNVIGQALDENGIKTILVNYKILEGSDVGVFTASIDLKPGENEVHIVVFDNENNFTEKKFTAHYSEPKLTLAEKLSQESNYYALIIGINHYDDFELSDLDNPIRDAQNLKKVLTTKYTFKEENVNLIQDATRDDIINSLDYLSKKLTSNDNLVIFYAGHGWFDQNANVGYWLPSDAKRNSKTAWFRNSAIVDYLKEIDCRHTLLITDACFGGAIFKTRSAFSDAPRAIEKLYELPSRKAMTSGTLTEVPDESAFVEFLLARLSSNTEKYLSAEQLFSGFRIAVINNSNAIPQFGEISGVGDEGGDFIFIHK